MDKNLTLKTLEQMDKVIDWAKIDNILKKYYKIGFSAEGADEYPPLMLFKCLLLQKWFRIPYDPHYIFSRIRKRVSKKAMIKINSEVLKHFDKKGLSINEGIAIDARLVQFASRPISNDEIKKLREKKETPDEKLDKNGKPIKFSQDSESVWTAIDDDPHYDLKEHASIDVNNGFILATNMTPASYHESLYLPYCTIYRLHTDQPLQKVYADKGYFGKPNRDFLNINGIEDGSMRKDTTIAKLTEYEVERNIKLAKKRYIVEQYFGLSHLHDGAKLVRFITIIKNTMDAMFRQFAFNLNRGSKLLGFT